MTDGDGGKGETQLTTAIPAAAVAGVLLLLLTAGAGCSNS
jgi:hypothetical protein